MYSSDVFSNLCTIIEIPIQVSFAPAEEIDLFGTRDVDSDSESDDDLLSSTFPTATVS